MDTVMRKIYLARHGESTWNVARRVQGDHEGIVLSERGREQARQLGARLAGTGFDGVYCSSAKRAVETARLALGEDRPVEMVDGLREIGFGAWEGLLVGDVRERYPGELERWFRSPSRVVIEGGEPFASFHRRAVDTVDGIVGSSEGDILIIAHGGVICTWLTHILGMDIDDIWSFSLPNASLTIVKYDFKPRLLLFGDVSHLDAGAAGFEGMPSPASD